MPEACSLCSRQRLGAFTALALALGICACQSAPPRKWEEDLRTMRSFERGQAYDQAAEQMQPGDLAALVRDLDSPDAQRYASAKARLRRNDLEGCAFLCESPLPETVQGRMAAVELMMLCASEGVPADCPQGADVKRRIAALLAPAETTALSGDEINLALQVMDALDQFGDKEDAPGFARLLASPVRAVRWRAAAYFGRHPVWLSDEALVAAAGRLAGEDELQRVDAANFLVDMWRILTAPVTPAQTKEAPAVSPYGAAPLREAQALEWRQWAAASAPELVRQLASAGNGAEESGD